jgi:Phosphate-selective porin O and P
MKRTVFSLGLTALLASTSAWALKVPTSSTDFDFNVNVLLQPRVELTRQGSVEKSLDTDFFLRRARLQASGTAYKTLSFLIQFDNSNEGKRGTPTSVGTATTPAFVQDLIVGWTPFPDFTIEAGLILEPTLRTMGYSASGGQVRIEAPIDTIMDNQSRGFRENGIELRGFVIGHIIHYRLGLWEGMHSQNAAATNLAAPLPAANAPVNPGGKPLVGGHVRINLIGDETGYAFNQMYMDGKVRASVGGAVQYQPRSACYVQGTVPVCSLSTGSQASAATAASASVNDYKAYGVDAYLGLPLPGNDVELSVDGSFMRWDYGAAFQKTGDSASVGVALRFGSIGLYADWWKFTADAGTALKLFDRRKVDGGIAFFIKGHADKVTLEVNNIVPGPTGGATTSAATGIAPIATLTGGTSGPSTTAIWVQAQAAF